MQFSGKAVLITGAGAGIGRAVAELFARAGAKVAVNSVSARGAETLALVKKAGADGLFVQGDVASAADAERMVAATVRAFGTIDIVVNVAGVVIGGRVDNMSEQDFVRTMDVNVKGTFLVCKYAVLAMKKRGGGGVIVNISSVAALKGLPDRSAYAASKGAVVALSKAMAADYIKDNIRVNVVCPGTTDTPSLAERMQAAADPVAAKAAFIARQPMGRLGTAAEIAQAILFACCDEAAFMNGSVIAIDGGMTI